MAKQRTVQSSFLTGVLDPGAGARVGTDAYDNGVLVGRNVIPRHLGGMRRRPGMGFVERLSNRLTFQIPNAATAPRGGTAANGYDEDTATVVLTTTNISTINPYIVIRYDLGAAVTVRHVDIVRAALTAGSSDEFDLQYSENDSTWESVSSMLVDTTERSYRFTPVAGSAPIVAQYWRIAKTTATDLSTAKISVAEFSVWIETATVSAVRLIPSELSPEQQYMVALTDHAGYVYQNGVLAPGGYLPLPYASVDLSEIDAAVGADSLFQVHEDYPPRFVIRSETGLGYNDFQTDEVEFSNIPQHDFNDALSPTPVSEVQTITFSAGWIAGDAFQIELDGARSASVAYAGDATAAQQAATAANIAREVQKLYSVSGTDGVTAVRTSALLYTVTLAGSSAKPYGLMTVLPLVTAGTATVTGVVARTATGVSREEDAWSATRGYPRTVAFFEGRLFFGGTRSLPRTLFGSAVNDITNFEILQALDGDAVFVTLDGPQATVINGLFSGRSFQLFTSGGEFRYIKQPGEPITPGDAPKNQTQYGAAKIRPVSVDGSTIFVQRTRKAIRDFKFDVNEDAYASLGLSSLAPHLINAVVDITAWNGSSTDEINLVFVVNGDGTQAVLNTRREAEVTAWTQWITGPDVIVATDGTVSGHDLIKAAAAVTEDRYFATVRDIGGTDYLFLEVADEDMLMDASVLRTLGFSSTSSVWTPGVWGTGVWGAGVWGESGSGGGLATISLLSHLNGADCRVTVDGLVFPNVTPVGGEVTIEIPDSMTITADTEVRIGLNYDTEIMPMPLNAMGQAGQAMISKQRIVKVKVKVRNTLGLRMNGRVLPDRYFDIENFDSPAAPYSGNITIPESTNWDEKQDKIVRFTQVDPLPMEILGIQVDLESAI